MNDLTALAQQLHTLSVNLPDAGANAVSVKIPPFWTSRPEVWFAQVEAQFANKHIVAQDTRYNYVVSALDKTVAEEIAAFICAPPTADKYDAVKALLIDVYGLKQSEKDKQLLAISGLGDRKPTALLRFMDSLTAPADRKTTIYRALFLSHLPESIRVILSRNPPEDIEDLAKAADDILAAQTEKPVYSATIDAVKNNRHQRQNTHSQHTHNRCFFHYKFGKNARKCGNSTSTPCDMSHLIASVESNQE